MRVQKSTSTTGAVAAMKIVLGELRERARLLRQAIHEDDRMNESFEELFPTSDTAPRSSVVGSKATH